MFLNVGKTGMFDVIDCFDVILKYQRKVFEVFGEDSGQSGGFWKSETVLKDSGTSRNIEVSMSSAK